jgi:hypothetical protein
VLLSSPGARLNPREGIVVRVGRRPLLVLAGWLGAVVLAVLVGLAAISVIGPGLAARDTEPMSEAQVAAALARASAPPTAAARPTGSAPGPSVPAGGGRGTLGTKGGSVVARCVGTRVRIVAMSPAQGYRLHESDQGPRDVAEGAFRATNDDHDRVKVEVRCVDGTPAFQVRTENG